MANEYKYYCDQCKFGAQYKSIFDQHCQTILHITGKKKQRKDKKPNVKCTKCEYETKLDRNLKLHILNKHSTKEEREKGFTYYCKGCDFGVFSDQSYETHCETLKHKRQVGQLK